MIFCQLVQITLRDDASEGVVPLYFTTAPFDVSHDGHLYIASGEMLEIGDTETSYELSTEGMTITLSGIDIGFREQIDNLGFLKAPIDVINAQIPYDTNVPSAVSYHFRGFVDSPTTVMDETSISIQVECLPIMQDTTRSPEFTNTSHAQHRAKNPGDKFFIYVSDTSLVEETWKT